MHTVFSQGDMQVAGETGLSQLQPASNLLQAAEQGKAEGGAGRDFGGLWGSHRLGSFRLWGFRLRPSLPFIGWKKVWRKLIYSGQTSKNFTNFVD